MIDLHAHILPGMDDGASDWDEAIEMARLAHEDGVRTIVACVHAGVDSPPDIGRAIAERAGELQRRLDRAGIPVKVLRAAEIMVAPEVPERIEDGALPTINGTRYCLLELPMAKIPRFVPHVVFELCVKGYKPIIAHPERNAEAQKHPTRLLRLLEMGALAQISVPGLMGMFGRGARKLAERLLREGWALNIASDAHSAEARPPVLSPAVRRAAKFLGREEALKLVEENAAKILAGEPLPEP